MNEKKKWISIVRHAVYAKLIYCCKIVEECGKGWNIKIKQVFSMLHNNNKIK